MTVTLNDWTIGDLGENARSETRLAIVTAC